MARKKIPEEYQPWIEARKRFHLSDAHVQMAKELGLNSFQQDGSRAQGAKQAARLSE